MIKYSFAKMNGAGNDFIMFDLDKVPLPELTPQRIQLLCNRKFGIGADGVITISNAKDNEFSMKYYNADGSSGSLCGNGARCAIRFAHLSGKFHGNSVVFYANNTKYHGELLLDNQVKFFLSPVDHIKAAITLHSDNHDVVAHFADTGSPHITIFVGSIGGTLQNASLGSSIDEIDVKTIGRTFRYHPFFANGVNVNFVQVIDKKLIIRTYERGVEAETLACGTGSVASALIGSSLGFVSSPVALITRSGKTLLVEFSFDNGIYQHITLTGPADLNFTGEFEIN